MSLVVCTLVVQATCAIGLLLLGVFISGFRALRWWAASYVLLASAPLLVTVSGFTLDHLLLGGWLALAGTVLITQGIAEHFWPGSFRPLAWGAGVLLAVMAADVVAWRVTATLAVYVAAFCSCFALQLVLSARLLWRNHQLYERTAARFMAAMLIGVALLGVIRAILTMLGFAPVNLFVPSPVRTIGVAFYLLFSVALAFQMVWLVTARLRRQMEEQARQDPLTSLANRRALDEAMARELARCQREGAALAAISIDLDQFKLLNDRHGHAAGDAMLVAVAQCLRAAVRPTDILARYGGEEFIAVLPGMAAEPATAVAERLRAQLSQLQVEAGRNILSVTASCGVVVALPGEAATGLLHRADRAMYAAKTAGRNCVHVEPALVLAAAAG